MKNTLAFLLLAVSPTIAFAAHELPNPKPGEEICYVRVYSAEHLEENPKQAIKAVAVTLYRGTESYDQDVVYGGFYAADLEGRVYFNAGMILEADGTRAGKLPAKRIATQLDGDGGRFLVTQSQKNAAKITAKVVHSLTLEEEDADEESSRTFSIQAGGVDSTMVLERRVPPEHGPSCATMMKSEIVAEAFRR